MQNADSIAILENGSGIHLFLKIYRNNIELEYLKGKRLYESSLKGGFYLAPKPLFVIKKYKIIIWKYFPNLIDCRTYLMKMKILIGNRFSDFETIFLKIGKILADLHCNLKFKEKYFFQNWIFLPSKGKSNLLARSKKIIDNSDKSFLHGDFGCANLFINKDKNENSDIVVLDASPNCFLYTDDIPLVFGSVYFDLAQFISSLNSHFLFYLKFRHNIIDFCELFLKGYEERKSTRIDRSTIFFCAAECLLKYRSYQINRSRMLSFKSWNEASYRKWSANKLYKIALSYYNNSEM